MTCSRDAVTTGVAPVGYSSGRDEKGQTVDEAQASEWRDRLSRLQADYEQRLSGLRRRESAVQTVEMKVRADIAKLSTERDQLKAGAVALTAEADALRLE